MQLQQIRRQSSIVGMERLITCVLCGFENLEGRKHCGVCMHPLKNVETAAACDSFTEWQCSMCTHVNVGAGRACEICNWSPGIGNHVMPRSKNVGNNPITIKEPEVIDLLSSDSEDEGVQPIPSPEPKCTQSVVNNQILSPPRPKPTSHENLSSNLFKKQKIASPIQSFEDDELPEQKTTSTQTFSRTVRNDLSKEEQRLFKRLNDKRKQGIFAYHQIQAVCSENLFTDAAYCKMMESAMRLLEENEAEHTRDPFTFNRISWTFKHVSEDLELSCFKDNRLVLHSGMEQVEEVHCNYTMFVYSGAFILEMKRQGQLSELIQKAMDSISPAKKCSATFVIPGLEGAIRAELTQQMKADFRDNSRPVAFSSLEEAEAFFIREYLDREGRFRFRFFPNNSACSDYIWQVTKNLARKFYEPPVDPRRFCKPKKSSGVGGTHGHKEWFNFLLQFPQVSESRAEAIIRHYSCFRALMEGYEECQSDQERSLMLADIMVGSKRLGPKVSSTVFSYIYGR